MSVSRFRVAGLVLVLLELVSFLVYADELVREEIVEFKVTKDSSVDNFVVKYQGYIHRTQRQEGEHSSIFHPVDTRRCIWSVRGYIQRIVCSVTSVGEFCKGEWSKILESSKESSKEGEGAKVDFLRARFQGENCGKARSRIQSDYVAVKQGLIDSFESNTETDLDEVLEDFEGTR